MRRAAIIAIGMGLMGAAFVGATAQAGYYCSPGFAAAYGGQCVAVASRYEVELYRNDISADIDRAPVRHHRRRHRVVTARY